MKRTVALAVAACAVVGLLLAMAVRAPIGTPGPVPVFNFRVEIDGLVSTSFQSVSGLNCTTDVIEFRQGGDLGGIQLLPGDTRCGPIDLKRGISSNLELWNWYQQTVSGQVSRRSGSVVLMDQAHNDVARWNFVNAWPSKYVGPSLDAQGHDVAMEEIVLQTEGITRVQ